MRNNFYRTSASIACRARYCPFVQCRIVSKQFDMSLIFFRRLVELALKFFHIT